MSHINSKLSDPVSNLVFDTLKIEKQAIVFVNAKRSAESVADKVLLDCKSLLSSQNSLAKEVLNVLSSPTRQCHRLSKLISKGVAFHHSGLSSKQRALVEQNFKSGKIKVICATPTLAVGLDLPAFRVIIRDVKRFGNRGMVNIPVLEYEQMSGRAGRPKFDKKGEAVLIAKNDGNKEKLWYEYILGEPEDIISKLAVKPILRIYVLSVLASGFASSYDSLIKFMSKTFYAHQYGNLNKLSFTIRGILEDLDAWEFIRKEESKSVDSDFVSASSLTKGFDIEVTRLGHRVSELYLDPLTANFLLDGMRKSVGKKFNYFNYLCMAASCIEMRPLIRYKQKELEEVYSKFTVMEGDFTFDVPQEYTEEFNDFLHSIKTSMVLERWMDEASENELYDKLGVTPGELNGKIERTDWIFYSIVELAKLQGFKDIVREISKLRVRVTQGVKEDLLTLLKLKHIGRVRARSLAKEGLKDLGKLKNADASRLVRILGGKVANKVRLQLGQEELDDDSKVKKRQKVRKGQLGLDNF